MFSSPNLPKVLESKYILGFLKLEETLKGNPNLNCTRLNGHTGPRLTAIKMSPYSPISLSFVHSFDNSSIASRDLFTTRVSAYPSDLYSFPDIS